jgi:hypothetical protein
MRYLVTSLDIHRLGELYIGLQSKSKKEDDYVVGSILRSGAHAIRGHSTWAADTVRHLLLEQTTDDPEMELVKDACFWRVRWSAALLPIHCLWMHNYQQLTVFGVSGGKPLLALVLGRKKGLERMEGTHPVWKELFDVYEGTTATGPGYMCSLEGAFRRVWRYRRHWSGLHVY